jgi:anthranilate/para-aminobenzoate synthase component I
MIIDLMRNDLYRMARPGGVHVVDPGTVHSFANVHHLIGVVEASLRSDLSWGDIARALCPGGSITGAPKREVMLAIREYEQRERGYLMGHLIYVDAQTGRADASILIRTAVRLADGMWEFAAGSGLVIHSQPEEEAAEVQAKARVILADP